MYMYLLIQGPTPKVSEKITSPNVSNCEILGAHWHFSLYEKSKFFWSPKGKS